MKKKRFLLLLLLPAVAAILAQAAWLLVWNGVILLNNPSKKTYPVRGVDVSHYQGEIDWAVLAGQNVDFTFIKATEGSSFTDGQFADNAAGAQAAGIPAGAYHFFSFDSTGAAQAAHFTGTVIPWEGMLPPVIDLEFYGTYADAPKEKSAVTAELDAMLTALTEHYGLRPILYATEEAYGTYLAGGYAEYDIWIRDVIAKPRLADGRTWRFWQYTNRGQLAGYAGEEKFIDLNVFAGTAEEFANYPRYGAK